MRITVSRTSLSATYSTTRERELAGAWSFLRRLARPSPGGQVRDALGVEVAPSAARGWSSARRLDEETRQLLDLYVPLCAPSDVPVRVVAHLGQSVDGFVAGADGKSHNLSDRENIVHLHRLRALFDAVVVGVNTLNEDDPRLTTRLVEGPNPVRVVLDGSLRSRPDAQLFSDELAPSYVVCCADAPKRSLPSAARVLRLHERRGIATVADALAALRAEGVDRFFVEGGGVTVSRSLGEGVLDRLHVAVAPVVIGDGRRGVELRGIRRFSEALRPPCRPFSMGGDVLFDFDLREVPGLSR